MSGPIHAGTFGPNTPDSTFGPELKFVKAPADAQSNLPPSAGLQFFGHVGIAADTHVMTVTPQILRFGQSASNRGSDEFTECQLQSRVSPSYGAKRTVDQARHGKSCWRAPADYAEFLRSLEQTAECAAERGVC